MTKGEYPYPADEFDTVERGSVPRGVHRSGRSLWKRVWPFLLVILVFPALAYGAVTYWSGTQNGAPTTSAPVAVAPSDAATDTTPAETPAATTPAETPAETPASTPSSTPSSGPAPILSTPVVVSNSTTRSGLAGVAVKALTDAGWKSATPANYTGANLTGSTVLYGTAALEPTAQAAAKVLGIKNVKLSASVKGLQVVLENDYTP